MCESRISLISASLFLCLMISGVNGEDGVFSSFWSKVKEGAQKMADSMSGWLSSFKEEVASRVSEVSNWTQNKWNSFKESMKDMVNRRTDITETEKEDMNDYIKNLPMPGDNYN